MLRVPVSVPVSVPVPVSAPVPVSVPVPVPVSAPVPVSVSAPVPVSVPVPVSAPVPVSVPVPVVVVSPPHADKAKAIDVPLKRRTFERIRFDWIAAKTPFVNPAFWSTEDDFPVVGPKNVGVTDDCISVGGMKWRIKCSLLI